MALTDWQELSDLADRLRDHTLVGETIPCRDEDCGGKAEQERDGDHIYFECEDCGFTFGYERVPETDDETCATGQVSVGEMQDRAATVAQGGGREGWTSVAIGKRE